MLGAMSQPSRWQRVVERSLDVLVPVSFGKSGYRLRRRWFDDLNVDLRGRTALVTGGSRGIGLAIVEALRALGANVVVAARDVAAARAACEPLTGAGSLEVHELDVSSLASVHALADRLHGASLDIVIHNGGGMYRQQETSVDGLELTWATHVVGPFALTYLLLPQLEQSDDARVITVSSGGQYMVALPAPGHVDDPYDGVKQYAYAKRAQLALTRWWSAGGSPIGFYSMHPGWVDTKAVADSMPSFYRWTKPILRTPAQGADTAVWLAAAPRRELADGGFYFDRALRKPHLFSRADADDAGDVLAQWCQRATLQQ